MSKRSAYLMAVLAFGLGFLSGNYQAKQCPPVPAPAAQPAPPPAKDLGKAADGVKP